MADRPTRPDPLEAAWPASTAALSVRVVDGLRVLALRHLPGGDAALAAALAAQGLPALPAPGRMHGTGPWLVWCRPGECLLLSADQALADGLLQALAPGREALACALDATDGGLVIELQGPGLDGLLPRLFDASAIPRLPGQATRTRWPDAGALLMRHAGDRAWLRVDRSHGDAAAQWITHALAAVAGTG